MDYDLKYFVFYFVTIKLVDVVLLCEVVAFRGSRCETISIPSVIPILSRGGRRGARRGLMLYASISIAVFVNCVTAIKYLICNLLYLWQTTYTMKPLFALLLSSFSLLSSARARAISEYGIRAVPEHEVLVPISDEDWPGREHLKGGKGWALQQNEHFVWGSKTGKHVSCIQFQDSTLTQVLRQRVVR